MSIDGRDSVRCGGDEADSHCDEMRRRGDEELQVVPGDEGDGEHRLAHQGDGEPGEQLDPGAREQQRRRADAADDGRELSEVAVGHGDQAYGGVVA